MDIVNVSDLNHLGLTINQTQDNMNLTNMPDSRHMDSKTIRFYSYMSSSR